VQADRPPPDNFEIINRPPPQIPQSTVPIEDKTMKNMKFLIPIFEQYLTKCLNEKPDMLIGEAIGKLDILTVNEAMALLSQYKKANLK
jgi:hypothetical protein